DIVEAHLAGLRRGEAKLVLDPEDGIARRRWRHQEGGDATARVVAVDGGEDDGDVGGLAVRHELLGAAEPIAAVAAPGFRRDGESVRSGFRLSQAEGAVDLPLGERPEVTALLHFRAVAEERA